MVRFPVARRQGYAGGQMQRYAGYQQGAYMLGKAARYAADYYGKRAAPQSYSKPKYKKQKTQSTKKTAQKVQQMSKTVHKLQKASCDSESTYKYRELEAATYWSLDNSQKVTTWGNPCLTSAIKTVLSAVPFFNPSSPGTLTTTDMTTGTYGKGINIDRVTSTIQLLNNYQVPADVTVYLCTAKSDSSYSAHGAWSNSVADESNLALVEQLGQYPTDYSLVNNLWKLKRVFKGILQPGDTKTLSHTVKDVCYDPSDEQAQTDTYQVRHKAFQFLLVFKGRVGHDTSAAEFTNIKSGLDVQGTNTYLLKYDAGGAKIDRVYVNNLQHTAFTNGGVVSNKPISDNQGFSVV